VRHCLQRSDVDAPTFGAHQFRHGLATEMLRGGASLGEIGDLLGHRHSQTTMIYTKVDLEALRKLALPWPGVRNEHPASGHPRLSDVRRDLGFKLREAGKGLLDFAAFMRQRHAAHHFAVGSPWAQQPRDATPAHWAQRLSFVRGFARYRSATDPRTQIPPSGLLPFQPRRASYLY
jgi:hypothetical protein